MALVVGSGRYEGRAEIAGTVANALAHHYGIVSELEAESLAATLMSTSGLSEGTKDKLRSIIGRITGAR